MIKINSIDEYGIDHALKGLSFSYQTEKDMIPIADKLAHKDDGHNKFLESIAVWIDIFASRYWWVEMDTYRCGMSKQSESTMHTLTRKPLTHADFGHHIPQNLLDMVNEAIRRKDLILLKGMLPESFVQRRMICTNYKTLRHIYKQRKDHRLQEWQTFCLFITHELKHPNWIV